MVVASIIIWLLSLLVLRGVNQAVAINAVVVIAKCVPIVVMVVAIILAGAFKWDIFMDNFTGEGSGMTLLEQVKSTVYTTVWTFIGIEGAVVLSGRGKNTKVAGIATVISLPFTVRTLPSDFSAEYGRYAGRRTWSTYQSSYGGTA